jgi:hypothetical protein
MEMPTNIQPKAAVPRALSSILPSMTGSAIRPASSVSTQTGGSTQMNATSTQVQTQKAQTKVCLLSYPTVECHHYFQARFVYQFMLKSE